MDILKLYESMLKAAGAVVDEKGFVSNNLKDLTGEDNTPLTVGGKRLVIPNEHQLKTMFGSNNIAFHPLYEFPNRGESEVINKLRSMINVKLSYTLAVVMTNMISIACSIAEHHKLNPDQAEFLTLFTNIDETTLVNFTNYITALNKAGDNTHMVNIYLKRGGLLNKVRRNRVGVVSFQAYKEIKDSIESKTNPHGVKLRVKDKEIITKLFEYILPGIDKDDAYSVGSDSDVAPYTDALMRSFGGVAAKLNDILVLFKKRIEGANKLIIDSDWEEYFDNLVALVPAIRGIPMQAGNEGAVRSGSAPVAVKATKEVSALVPNVTNVPAPVTHTAPQVHHVPTAPVPQPFHTPFGQPQFQQPPVPQAPPVNDVASFRAAMRHSPMGMPQLPPELQRQAQVNMNPHFMPTGGYPTSGWFAQQQQQQQYSRVKQVPYGAAAPVQQQPFNPGYPQSSF